MSVPPLAGWLVFAGSQQRRDLFALRSLRHFRVSIERDEHVDIVITRFDIRGARLISIQRRLQAFHRTAFALAGHGTGIIHHP